MGFRQLVESADSRPVDLPIQPRGRVIGPHPVVLSQGLFGHLLDSGRVAFGQVGLVLQCGFDGAVGGCQATPRKSQTTLP